MSKSTSSLFVIAALSGACLTAAPAHAQLARTFVSAATGSDANDCSRPTPCRSFQGAHDKTGPDGEITVLDSGGYGAIRINKSISIVNDGVGEASILVSGSATAITIDAPATSAVNLRGLTIQGIGFGSSFGLLFRGGSSLTITKCVFRNLTGDGIAFEPSDKGTYALSIADTLVADNGGAGISVFPTVFLDGPTNVRAAIARVRVVNNSHEGVLITGGQNTGSGTVSAAVTDSVSANNGRDGFLAVSSFSDMVTNLTLLRSVSANNGGSGIAVAEEIIVTVPTVRLWASQSAITGNAKTWSVSGNGGLKSLGDNYIAGNADGDPAPPTTARK